MSNRGVSPVDTASEVGQLRLLVGDTSSIPLSPAVSGFADYSQWSDDALQVALTATGGNQLRAAGTLYLQLAAEFSMTSRSIATDDLRLDTKHRGADLLKVAQSFFDQADGADAESANDFFQIVPRASSRVCVRPEGTPYPRC